MNYSITFIDYFKPKEKILLFFYYLILIGGGVIIISISARIVIPLPFTPVPITAQTFSVLFLSALYGRNKAVITISLYLLGGIAGLPLFQNSNSGILYLISSATTGYIIGFLFAAYIVGYFSEKGWDKKLHFSLFSMIIGNLIIYLFGLLWLNFIIKAPNVFHIGFFPFIIGDLFKILFASILLPFGWKIIKKINKGGI